MKRSKQVCYLPESEAERGEFGESLCGLSGIGVRRTRDRESVTCPLCSIQLECVDKYESDSDPTPDDIDLIPYFLENA